MVGEEPSPVAPSGAAGACRCEIEVESDVTVLLLQKDSVHLVTIKRDLVQSRGTERESPHRLNRRLERKC